MFHIKVVEKIKTRILCSITFFFPAKIVPFMRYSGKYGTAGQTKVYDTAG